MVIFSVARYKFSGTVDGWEKTVDHGNWRVDFITVGNNYNLQYNNK